MQTHELFNLNYSYWILQTVAMLFTALLIPRLRITSIFGALFTVITLAFINSKVWDAALFFQIPNSFNTQALLLFGTNGIIFWLVVKFLPGIEVDGFLPALVAPVVFTICSLIISAYAGEIDWLKVLEYIINFLSDLKAYFENANPTLVNDVPVNDVSVMEPQPPS